MTSDERDFDPDYLLRKIRLNKINHKNYNATYNTKEWSKHFKEVITKLNKSGIIEKPIDFNKEFDKKPLYVPATSRNAFE